MHKLIALFSMLSLCLFSSGCGGKDTVNTVDGRVRPNIEILDGEEGTIILRPDPNKKIEL